MGIVQIIEVAGSAEGSLGFVLPDDVLARLQLAVGDTVMLTETAHGLRLTAARPPSGETASDTTHPQ
jgi:hypothetical protein